MKNRKHKVGDTVNYLGEIYAIKSSKKNNPMYGQPTYNIESIKLDEFGCALKISDVPQSILK